MIPNLEFHNYMTILNWVLKCVEYLAKIAGMRQGENRENRILDYLNTKSQPSDLSILWADIFLRPVIEDVPFAIAFPPQLKGWQRLKFELKKLPYEARNRWRVWTRLISEEQAKTILLKLLREHRIQYDPQTQRFFRKE